MGKLKSSLGAYQVNAARAAAAKAREENKNTKVVHRSAAEKRNLKRQRKEKEDRVREQERVAALRKGKGKARDTAEGDEEQAAGVLDPAAAARATIPIAHDDTVLLLGEANFSFACSLLLRGHAGHLICATAYDSETECEEKYPDAAANISTLRTAGARVVFGVDGGALEKSKEVGKGHRYSRVVFNFPHVGKGITDQDRNVRANQEMLLRTMRSVSPLLTIGPSAFPLVEVKKGGKKKLVAKAVKRKVFKTEVDSDDEAMDEEGEKADAIAPASFMPPNREGTLLITLLDQMPYTLWDVKALATKPPPSAQIKQPRYRLLRSFEFVPAAYPGYAHRRTLGWREGKSLANNEEILGRKGRTKTYEFALREEEDE